MKVFKSEFGRALKFASIARSYAHIKYEDDKLKISAISADHFISHETIIGVADKHNQELDTYVDIERILPLLRALGKVIDISATDHKLILADDFLTYEIALLEYEDNVFLKKFEKDAEIRFYQLDISELKMFFKLAKTISDFIDISVNGSAILKTKSYGTKDEVQLSVTDSVGEASSTYHTEHLAKISSFLKNEAKIQIEDHGPMVFEFGYGVERYKLQLANVEV